LKILYISSAEDIAGGEIHLVNLIKGMISSNVEVFLACREKSVIGEKAMVLNARVINLPLHGSLDFYSSMKIRKILKDNDIDILHAHLGRDYIPAGLSLTCGRLKTKFVLTRHILLKLKNSFLHKIILRNTSKLIGVSESVCNVLRQETNIDSAKIICIPNGVVISEFENAIADFSLVDQFNLCGSSPIIGVIGKLSPHKGQSDLIKAVPMILESEPDAHFVIVGDTMEHDRIYDEKLKKLVKDLNVSDRVHFTGFKNNIAGILKTFTISVVPSWEEPFGLSIIESMACKVPVVATNSAGASEIIEDGVNGYLCRPKDPASIAKTCLKLLSDPGKRIEFSRSGFETVREKYSIDSMIKKTKDIYFSLLNQ